MENRGSCGIKAIKYDKIKFIINKDLRKFKESYFY
jgi:hypothetical protein